MREGIRRTGFSVPKALDVLNLFSGPVVERFQYLRELRPGGWNPKMRIEGREHIDRGLTKGRGVILWIFPLQSSSLVTKKAFHAAGFEVVHLSRVEHGFFSSRLGIRFLNPIQTGLEERFLADRVLVDPDGGLRYLRALERHLTRNGILSIMAYSLGRRVEFSSVMGLRVGLAGGAPGLALGTGAVLLPVFSLPEGSTGYRVVVGRPLAVRAGTGGRRAVRELVREMCGRAEVHLRRHPWAWYGWVLTPDPPPEAQTGGRP